MGDGDHDFQTEIGSEIFRFSIEMLPEPPDRSGLVEALRGPGFRGGRKGLLPAPPAVSTAGIRQGLRKGRRKIVVATVKASLEKRMVHRRRSRTTGFMHDRKLDLCLRPGILPESFTGFKVPRKIAAAGRWTHRINRADAILQQQTGLTVNLAHRVVLRLPPVPPQRGRIAEFLDFPWSPMRPYVSSHQNHLVRECINIEPAAERTPRSTHSLRTGGLPDPVDRGLNVMKRRLGHRQHSPGRLGTRQRPADRLSGTVVNGAQQLPRRILIWNSPVVAHEYSAIRSLGSGQDAGS